MSLKSNIGNFTRDYLMRLKTYQDKGREYYQIVYSIVTISILIGVWLPYIQEWLADVGINVSRLTITVIGLGGLFLFVNVSLVVLGWFTFKKNITQSENIYKALQTPNTMASFQAFSKILRRQEILHHEILDPSKENLKICASDWKKLDDELSAKMTLGDITVLDVEHATKNDYKKLEERAKSMSLK